MQRKFLDFLIDPMTKEPLKLTDEVTNDDEIESGFLKSSKNSYPIINGIPRFVDYRDSNYARSFGYQWNKWKKIQFESENKGKRMEGYTTMMWERIAGFSEKKRDLKEKLVVDIGCGPGRFTDVARSQGAIVIGIDYSQAVETAKENFRNDKNVCIIQADALCLPIREASVDAAFSIGVLHHTPDPKKGVAEAFRIIKPGGWFSLSVYSKGGYYHSFAVNFWRKIFKFLWPVFKQYPPLIYSYFTTYLIRPVVRLIPFTGKFFRLIVPFTNLDDRKWSLLDTFDSVTPSYQSSHESYEVYKWFVDSGYQNTHPTNWGSTAYVGEK